MSIYLGKIAVDWQFQNIHDLNNNNTKLDNCWKNSFYTFSILSFAAISNSLSIFHFRNFLPNNGNPTKYRYSPSTTKRKEKKRRHHRFHCKCSFIFMVSLFSGRALKYDFFRAVSCTFTSVNGASVNAWRITVVYLHVDMIWLMTNGEIHFSDDTNLSFWWEPL